MSTEWCALVNNGTFLDVLDDHRPRMEKEGFRLVEYTGVLTVNEARNLANDVDAVFGPGPGLDAQLFKNTRRLKVVSLAASGYESVDIKAATEAGIVVTNAPTPALNSAVADLTFGLILCVAREIPQRHHLLMTERISDRTMGRPVWGKTLGIVGLGEIGRAVVPRARGFNMRILVYNRSWRPEHQECAAQYNIERVDLDELLRESDYVSLHLRSTPDTMGFIGARELGLMKPTAYLINTARASLIDDDVLYDALISHRIGGAGLDTISGIFQNSQIWS